MARSSAPKGMQGMSKKPIKGRSEVTNKVNQKISTHRSATENEARTQANRPVSAGTAKRGDRRDMHPTYTGNTKHRARGNTARPNVATRKD